MGVCGGNSTGGGCVERLGVPGDLTDFQLCRHFALFPFAFVFASSWLLGAGDLGRFALNTVFHLSFALCAAAADHILCIRLAVLALAGGDDMSYRAERGSRSVSSSSSSWSGSGSTVRLERTEVHAEETTDAASGSMSSSSCCDALSSSAVRSCSCSTTSDSSFS